MVTKSEENKKLGRKIENKKKQILCENMLRVEKKINDTNTKICEGNYVNI